MRTFYSSSVTMPRRSEAAADKAGALGLECRIVWQATQGEAAELGTNSSRSSPTCRSRSTLCWAVERQP